MVIATTVDARGVRPETTGWGPMGALSSVSREFGIAEGLVRQLAAIYRVSDADVVEISLNSHAAAGAIVHPRPSAQLSPPEASYRLEASLRLSALSQSQQTIFRALHDRIPSRPYAIRLLVNGGGSLFWSIEIPAAGVEALAGAVGPARAAYRLRRFFSHLGRPACGFACEQAISGWSRARFYSMLSPCAGDLESLLMGAKAHLGLDRGLAERIRGEWVLINPRRAVVVDVDASDADGPSLKLEIPGPRFELAESLAEGPERSFVQAAIGQARRLGLARFDSLGIRYHQCGRRSLTAYIDARSVLAGPGDRPGASPQ